MSNKYKTSTDVPDNVLAHRLTELADYVCKTKNLPSEFSMRVPAEHDRDADLVFTTAACRLLELTQLRATNKRLEEEVARLEQRVLVVSQDLRKQTADCDFYSQRTEKAEATVARLREALCHYDSLNGIHFHLPFCDHTAAKALSETSPTKLQPGEQDGRD